MITSTLEVPLRLCVIGDPCWNNTSGVPTWVTCDAKPQRHSITEAFQIVTPGSDIALPLRIGINSGIYTFTLTCIHRNFRNIKQY